MRLGEEAKNQVNLRERKVNYVNFESLPFITYIQVWERALSRTFGVWGEERCIVSVKDL